MERYSCTQPCSAWTKGRAFTIALWLATAFPGAGLSDPEINFSTRFYPVQGNDIHSLYRSMQRNGPGGRFLARTDWDIRWSFSWTETGATCRLDTVMINANIGMLLPRPVSLERFSPSLQHSWKVFYDALLRHEQHHRDYGIHAAIELEQQLSATAPGSCSDFQNRLSQHARQIVEKYQAMENEYDRLTDHGIKEGVVLQ